MGDRRHTGKPSRYVFSHPRQLSLAIPSWIGAVSISESWDVKRHAARCTSFVYIYTIFEIVTITPKPHDVYGGKIVHADPCRTWLGQAMSDVAEGLSLWEKFTRLPVWYLLRTGNMQRCLRCLVHAAAAVVRRLRTQISVDPNSFCRHGIETEGRDLEDAEPKVEAAGRGAARQAESQADRERIAPSYTFSGRCGRYERCWLVGNSRLMIMIDRRVNSTCVVLIDHWRRWTYRSVTSLAACWYGIALL